MKLLQHSRNSTQLCTCLVKTLNPPFTESVTDSVLFNPYHTEQSVLPGSYSCVECLQHSQWESGYSPQ